ncbi:hypothetical protein BDN72DRAFT_895256 [Pluteus cervinus]|uniref:Uncharacterized protein n=1 Tax=Pluteus cervinus TaxID=181527 RepID=A0ACD3B1F4_9AGAR|nr:hypothetical protein BDN72DRAFT_895256 [Pluteus cervinus]
MEAYAESKLPQEKNGHWRNKLHNYLQQKPEYEVFSERQDNRTVVWTATVIYEGASIGIGKAQNKNLAMERAAWRAMGHFVELSLQAAEAGGGEQ